MQMEKRPTSFGYDDLLACARGELFGAGNAQLPLPPMLMFDRISEIAEAGGEYGKGLVRAVLELKPDLWFFGCHFSLATRRASVAVGGKTHAQGKAVRRVHHPGVFSDT